MRININLSYEELKVLKHMFEMANDMKHEQDDEDYVEAFDSLENKLGRIKPSDDIDGKNRDIVYLLKLTTSYFAPGYDDNTNTKYYVTKDHNKIDRKINNVKENSENYGSDSYYGHEIFRISLNELDEIPMPIVELD